MGASVAIYFPSEFGMYVLSRANSLFLQLIIASLMLVRSSPWSNRLVFKSTSHERHTDTIEPYVRRAKPIKSTSYYIIYRNERGVYYPIAQRNERTGMASNSRTGTMNHRGRVVSTKRGRDYCGVAGNVQRAVSV